MEANSPSLASEQLPPEPFPNHRNHLAADCYKGEIDHIYLEWAPNAIDRLPTDARVYNIDEIALKSITEHLVHASAKRLGRKEVRIYGSFHSTTTDIANGVTKPDGCHCTIKAADTRSISTLMSTVKYPSAT
ncbi:hypothetical protein EMCG_07038 [[Emmonsia] crescens]|uniref:Uncharacterized protein n=1 Tax=[Emmonsia] crescens TaxID=73230 RepID=A0A0G2IAG8_9EURO|nr:hypothetical protein EMCG_07038 [Emmonsia crescens UAMH 3008]